MHSSPQAILLQWIAAFNSGDVDAVLSLYDPGATLIPTFSNRIIKTPDAMREYFTRLAARDDLSVELHEKTLDIQSKDADMIHILIGTYCFQMGIDGELFRFEARFSFVMDLALERPIIHHHSSQIPRML